MWLRRLVAIVLIVACLGMNGLVVAGLFDGNNNKTVSLATQSSAEAPTITISVSPTSIPAGTTAAISWSTTGDISTCSASGGWSGDKTSFGAESTGRQKVPGAVTFTLTCQGKGGQTSADAVLTVTAANTAPAPTTPVATAPAKVSYCNGRNPCYGPKDIAKHTGAGNCWGWNGDRVINISGFDAAFHKFKSGIDSIEIGTICGKDLAPAINGSIPAGSQQPHNHKSTTKRNADTNELSFLVGYYDATKP